MAWIGILKPTSGKKRVVIIRDNTVQKIIVREVDNKSQILLVSNEPILSIMVDKGYEEKAVTSILTILKNKEHKVYSVGEKGEILDFNDMMRRG